MNSKISNEERYSRAKKRVEELKGFHVHLGAYLAVNTFLSIRSIYRDMQDGFSFSESFTEISTYWIWVFWGIGLFFHGLRVFGLSFFLGKDWEDRKIKKYMNQNNGK